MLVGHARGPDDADAADDLAVDFVGRGHNAAFVQGHHAGFAADKNFHTGRALTVVQDLQQLSFLLEHFKQFAQVGNVR